MKFSGSMFPRVLESGFQFVLHFTGCLGSAHDPWSTVVGNVRNGKHYKKDQRFMHGLWPKWGPSTDGEAQVRILRQSLSPQMRHQTRDSKHMGDVGFSQPVFCKHFHHRVHRCRGGASTTAGHLDPSAETNPLAATTLAPCRTMLLLPLWTTKTESTQALGLLIAPSHPR